MHFFILIWTSSDKTLSNIREILLRSGVKLSDEFIATSKQQFLSKNANNFDTFWRETEMTKHTKNLAILLINNPDKNAKAW